MDRKYCDRTCNNRHYKQIQSGKVPRPLEIDPVARLAEMTPAQLAWVTGIFEGEGCASISQVYRIGHLYVHSAVHVSMTDEDIIRRCAEWTGLGRVSGPSLPPCRAKAGYQPQWGWHVTKATHVEALVAAMWPLLGERRRSQVSAMRQRMAERTLKRG